MNFDLKVLTEAKLESLSEELCAFTEKLGLQTLGATDENRKAAVIGVDTWLRINGVGLENYKLAGKENIKTLSALLSRNCGSNSTFSITEAEYRVIIEELSLEMEPDVLLAYEALVRNLDQITISSLEKVALSIAYDFLASRSSKHINLAQLIIVNFYRA